MVLCRRICSVARCMRAWCSLMLRPGLCIQTNSVLCGRHALWLYQVVWAPEEVVHLAEAPACSRVPVSQPARPGHDALPAQHQGCAEQG